MDQPNKAQGPNPNRRKYIRIDTVLPVEFFLIDTQSGKAVSPVFQGFSNNIGKEGICLSAKNIDPASLAGITNKQAKISLKIYLPFRPKPVESLTGISWIKDTPDQSGFHSIGLHYEQIDKKENGLILRFARLKSLFAPVMLSVLALLLALSVLGAYSNWKLNKSNEDLVEEMSRAWAETTAVQQKLTEIASQKKEMESKIVDLEAGIQSMEIKRLELEAKAKEKESAASQEIERLSNLAAGLQKDKEALERDLSVISEQEDITKEKLDQVIREILPGMEGEGVKVEASEDGQSIQIWHSPDGDSGDNGPVK